MNSDWVWGRSSVQWHRLTISARTSSAGSNTWDSLLSSIFHSTLESLLSPGRSHCSREARWLAVKFSSCVCVKDQLRDWDKQSSPLLPSPPPCWVRRWLTSAHAYTSKVKLHGTSADHGVNWACRSELELQEKHTLIWMVLIRDVRLWYRSL